MIRDSWRQSRSNPSKIELLALLETTVMVTRQVAKSRLGHELVACGGEALSGDIE
jgi:hypothetical protein